MSDPGEPVGVRLATDADEGAILQWRNDPDTRQNSLDATEVSSESHSAWFRRMRSDPGRYLVVGEVDGVSVGVVHVVRASDDATARISINLNPSYRGQGLAAPLLRAAIDRYAEERGGGMELIAEIKSANEASLKTFAKAGFTHQSTDRDLEIWTRAL